MIARKNRKKGQARFPVPIPLAALIVVLSGFALLYVCLQSRTERLGREIKKLEADRESLRDQLVQEQNEWARLQAPANLDQALKAHGLVMTWPNRDRIVRLRRDGSLDLPRGPEWRPASRVARADRIVMND